MESIKENTFSINIPNYTDPLEVLLDLAKSQTVTPAWIFICVVRLWLLLKRPAILYVRLVHHAAPLQERCCEKERSRKKRLRKETLRKKEGAPPKLAWQPNRRTEKKKKKSNKKNDVLSLSNSHLFDPLGGEGKRYMFTYQNTSRWPF